MKKIKLFAKRNLTEMTRDPLLYIFCAGFPVAMLAMFQLIAHYSGDATPVFKLRSLIPGIMMFSYSLLMLMSALLVSKDKTSSFFKRIATSPLKRPEFIAGYFIPFFIVGLGQNVVAILAGYVASWIMGAEFITIGQALLLSLEMLPIMIFNIMLGMTLGILLNDKSAPAITSIFISGSGVVGGAWMPVDAMGGFEKGVSYLPFYPSVWLGRVITGATHTIPDTMGNMVTYSLADGGMKHVIVLGVYLIISVVLCLFMFSKMNMDK